MNRRLLSIVLLTWNSRAWLDSCVGSVFREVPEEAEVIVVDNGSQDGTVSELRKKFPRAIIIQNTHNKGVAIARNQGLRRSTGKFQLLLDSDAMIMPGAVSVLLRHLEAEPRIGIIGPRVLYPNGTVSHSCRKFPTLRSKFQRLFGWPAGASGFRDDEYSAMCDWREPHEVDYVIGACMLVRREAFEEVGLFDERVFYGPDDVDLCVRFWLAGWQVVYHPGAVIVHHEQRLTHKRITRLTACHALGLAYYFLKHRYLWSRERLYEKISTMSAA